MRSDWREVSLGDVIDIKHGFAFKSEYFVDKSTEYALVTPGNFAIGGGFQEQNPKFYKGPFPTEYILQDGDLVVTMTDLSKAGDTLGFGALIPKVEDFSYLHNQRVGLVQQKNQAHETDRKYLSYLLRMADYRHWIVGSATGSTVKHTSPNRIQAYKFSLPPLPEQKAIARVLASLDDKIELNRRTNTTLEALAQTLFRAWFVDFVPVKAKAEGVLPPSMDATAQRAPAAALFPSHFQENTLGLIPKGWKVGTLADVCEARRETVQPSFVDGDSMYVGLEHIPQNSIALNNWGRAEQADSTKSRFKSGDILFGKLRPYFHKVVVAPMDGICSTDILVLQSIECRNFGFVLCHASSTELIDYATRLSNGARMPRVGWKDIAAYSVVLPPPAIQEAFTEILQGMISKISVNVFESQTLAALRDALLPRLISGRLRVPEAMRAVEQENG